MKNRFLPTKCSGCQRIAMHKRCPAYGTKFYMSGEAFTEEVELQACGLIYWNQQSMEVNANYIYDFTINTRNKTMKTYEGQITELPENGVFVYGANTEGRHGAGAAKVAKEKFGAVYGISGFRGKSYGIITKDLTAHFHPSISKRQIIQQIGDMYKLAVARPDLEFWVAYSGTGKNLNAYTPQEMADMFSSHEIPANIVFEKSFYELMGK